ncbi:MAG: TRAP transporter substrate-binding protein DctP [Candidatus Atribacteria bacterium]|nr:TRAP transporter substrate-binding protein DctP [Candidatus Atribacteria bacterium]
MKKILVLICAVSILIVFFTGVGYSEQKEVITLKVSCQQVEDHENTKAMRRIEEKVETATNGGLILDLYVDSILGDYTTIFEEAMLGTVDMAFISVTGQYDPRLELLFIPYLFTDYAQAKKVFGPYSKLYGVYTKIVNDLGLQPLGIFGEGFIGVGTTKLDPNYADPVVPKTILLRVPPIESNKILVEAMNYNTVTIPYSDLFTALQTGVTDGWFGGTAELNYYAFRDAIKYYITYNALLENNAILMNKKKYDSLPDDYKKILTDACIEEVLASFDRTAKVDAYNLQRLTDYGIEVITISPEQLEKIAEHVRDVTWPVLEPKLTAEVMDAVREDLAK